MFQLWKTNFASYDALTDSSVWELFVYQLMAVT